MDTLLRRPSIGLIGAGRVGSALALALHRAGYPIVGVASRTGDHAAELAAQVKAPALPVLTVARLADLVLLVVPDDAISTLAQLVADEQGWRPGQMIVHASGALPAAALGAASAQGAQIGSWHPLAAFAERNAVLPNGVTFAIEAQGSLHDCLDHMTKAVGGQGLDLAAADKPLYHAAAVLASNYTVVLTALASQLLQSLGASNETALNALLPLLETTMANLKAQGLPAALTGPLVRGDVGTVERHLAALDHYDPQLAEVYRVLGQAALPLVADRQAAPLLSHLINALAK